MIHLAITPVNGHLIIDPLPRSSFMASAREIFEEVGVVTAVAESIGSEVNVGDKVYFDAWLAAKYPVSETEAFWLVKWEDVRAVEHAG